MRFVSRLISKKLIVAIFFGMGSVKSVSAESNKFFTFTFENDAFVGEDNGYTNGTGLTFGTAGFDEFSLDNVPGWAYPLVRDSYISGGAAKTRGIAHMFFQRMQTPEDIANPEFIADDLPYAGLLAWQGTAYSWDDKVSDQLSLILGMVGPAALAEPAQTLIHKIVSADNPEGWDFQLENEPVFKFEMHRTWNLYRSSESRRLQFDFVGLGAAGIGNLKTATKGGFAVRFGTNLGSSLAAFSLHADRHVNPLAFTKKNDFYLYLGARAGVVANDILITGNTFADSHSLPLEHFQNELAAGALWSFNRWAFVFALSSSSSQTEIVNDREKHGAFSVTYRFQD